MKIVLVVRWVLAWVVMVVGLIIILSQFLVVTTLLWKAAPFAKEWGVNALVALVSGSVVIALVAFLLFREGVKLFVIAGTLHKLVFYIRDERGYSNDERHK